MSVVGLARQRRLSAILIHMRERANVGKTSLPNAEALELPNAAQVAAAVSGFALLADATRLQLLWILGHSEYDVSTLAKLTGTTCAAASQHLAKLRLAGLVTVRQEGRRHVYAAHDTHVRQLIREALYHADHVAQHLPDHP